MRRWNCIGKFMIHIWWLIRPKQDLRLLENPTFLSYGWTNLRSWLWSLAFLSDITRSMAATRWVTPQPSGLSGTHYTAALMCCTYDPRCGVCMIDHTSCRQQRWGAAIQPIEQSSLVYDTAGLQHHGQDFLLWRGKIPPSCVCLPPSRPVYEWPL